jgi:hypothetical protein
VNVTLLLIAALIDGRVVDWLDDEKQDARYRLIILNGVVVRASYRSSLNE